MIAILLILPVIAAGFDQGYLKMPNMSLPTHYVSLPRARPAHLIQGSTWPYTDEGNPYLIELFHTHDGMVDK